MFCDRPALSNTLLISEEFPVRKRASLTCRAAQACDRGPTNQASPCKASTRKMKLERFNFSFRKKNLQDFYQSLATWWRRGGSTIGRASGTPTLIFIDCVSKSCGFGFQLWRNSGFSQEHWLCPSHIWPRLLGDSVGSTY